MALLQALNLVNGFSLCDCLQGHIGIDDQRFFCTLIAIGLCARLDALCYLAQHLSCYSVAQPAMAQDSWLCQ